MHTLKNLIAYMVHNLPRVEPLSSAALAPVEGERRRVFAGKVIITRIEGEEPWSSTSCAPT